MPIIAYRRVRPDCRGGYQSSSQREDSPAQSPKTALGAPIRGAIQTGFAAMPIIANRRVGVCSGAACRAAFQNRRITI